MPAATPPLGVAVTPPLVVPPVEPPVVVPGRVTVPPVLAGSRTTVAVITVPDGQKPTKVAAPEPNEVGTVKAVLKVPLAPVVVLPITCCIVGVLNKNPTLPPAVVPQTPLTVKVLPMRGVVVLTATLAVGSNKAVLKLIVPPGQVATIVTGPPPKLLGIAKLPVKLPLALLVVVLPRLVVTPLRSRAKFTVLPVVDVPQTPAIFPL